jgi:hypothetical protein
MTCGIGARLLEGTTLVTLTTQAVPDEIWSVIPPRRLPRRRFFAVLAVLLALGAAAVAVHLSGLLSPSLTTQDVGFDVKEGSKKFGTNFEVTNNGRYAVTLDRPALSAPWLTLGDVAVGPAGQDPLSPHPSATTLPVTLEPDQTVQIRLALTVTDCHDVSRSGSDVTLDATGPLTTRTISVRPPGAPDPNAPDSYSFSGADPWLVPWPVTPASTACSMPIPER